MGVQGSHYIFSSSYMLFYQIMKKNECDSQWPRWYPLGGSKIYHLKRGVSKQYFFIFLASGTMFLPYDLHLIGYQGHTNRFKVIREKTIKVSFEFHSYGLSDKGFDGTCNLTVV